MRNEIALQSVRDLLTAKAIRNTAIEATPNGFVIGFDVGMERRYLASQRGPARTFKTIDTTARFSRGPGIVNSAPNTWQRVPDA